MPRKLSKSKLVLGALSFASVIALTLGVVAAQGFGFIQRNRSDTAGGAPAKRGQPAAVTPQQLARLQEKIALVTGILDARKAEAEATGLANGWRQPYTEMLLPLSLDDLKQVGQADSLSQLSILAAETKVAAAKRAATPNALGSSSTDLVYVPIPPCRFVDTRFVGGAINGIRGYDLVTNGSTYGGSAACDPTALFGVGENSFGALAMNVTVVLPAANGGYVGIKPQAATPVTSSINWYEPNSILANTGIFTTDQTGAAAEFVVETSSSVHVLLDILGAFIAPEATPLNHQILLTSEAVAAGATFTILSPTCPVGFQVVGGGHRSSSFSGPAQLASSRPAANNSPGVVTGFNAATQWLVQGTAGGAITMESYVMCAQVPGR